MTEPRYSEKRARAYVRTFDWDEARRRYAAGEKQKDIAADMGVTRSAVGYACRLPDKTSVAPTFIPTRERCPTCQGPKYPEAAQCRACYQDSRLAVPTLIRHAGRRTPVGGVDLGRIVKYCGEWYVVERTHHKDEENRRLVGWYVPDLVVPASTRVWQPGWTEVVHAER